MKISVLSGSPKGEPSLTLQYLNYIKKHFPEHEFNIFHIGKEINKIEKGEVYFDSMLEEIEKSDGIIWVFPVYVFLAPSPVHRFAELIFEKNKKDIFKDKYATAITTSVHFYDHTAHNYIHSISEDLGMKYLDGFSAEMQDLLKEKEREMLLKFSRNFFNFIKEKMPVERKFKIPCYEMPEYKPGEIKENSKKSNKKIVVLTDAQKEDVNLNRMIKVFESLCPCRVEVINIREFDMKGGCVSCYLCTYDNECVYKDGFADIINKHVLPADGVVMAARIKGRYLSSRWKMYMDRSFFKGHCPVFEGKQFGYLISGPLRDIANVRQVLEAKVQMGRANLAGMVTDEYEDSHYITSLIETLVKQMVTGIEEKFLKPRTYLEVGGHMIFRDLVYRGWGMFRADYLYYKKHNLFDYPQKNFGERLQNLMFAFMLMLPGMKKEFYKKAKEEMIKPHQKVIEKF